LQYPRGGAPTDAKNIRESDLYPLVPGQINPSDSGQLLSSLLPLALLVFGIFADHPHHPLAANNLALGAHAFH
jgi:hypothetical protein